MSIGSLISPPSWDVSITASRSAACHQFELVNLSSLDEKIGRTYPAGSPKDGTGSIDRSLPWYHMCSVLSMAAKLRVSYQRRFKHAVVMPLIKKPEVRRFNRFEFQANLFFLSPNIGEDNHMSSCQTPVVSLVRSIIGS